MSTDMEVHKRDRPMARLFDWFEPAELSKFFEGFRPFEDRIRVEEEVVGDDLVIRAELPGIDPDKDVDITVDGDVMTMTAERRKEETDEDRQRVPQRVPLRLVPPLDPSPTRREGRRCEGRLPRRDPRSEGPRTEDRHDCGQGDRLEGMTRVRASHGADRQRLGPDRSALAGRRFLRDRT